MSGNIKVVVRCRPLNTKEIARNATHLVRMEGNQTLLSKPKAKKTASYNTSSHQKALKLQPMADDGNNATASMMKAFTFDKSYWSADKSDIHYADQEQVYNDIGTDLLDHAFDGYNCCIFAYGQTGSGKSYTMMGYGEEKGIIPRTCMELFERIGHLTTDSLQFQVEVSYLEIYNEKVRDLLNPENKGNLKVREHPTIGPYVEDLSRLLVSSYEDMEHLMNEGNKARTVAATNMNETSSRSHAVFTILLTSISQQQETLPKSDNGSSGQTKGKVSRISLVDLAGSERANSTGATGIRLKEGANINKSLATLGKVIAALAEQSSSNNTTTGTTMMKRRSSQTTNGTNNINTNVFIPYRDSVLTWLLKDSLGGNSKTTMIATISPTDYEETLSTLRYADQAKHIKNKPIVNEDPNARLIRELKEELQALRDTLMVYAPEEVQRIAQKQQKQKKQNSSAASVRSAASPPPFPSIRDSSPPSMLLISPQSPVASAQQKRNSLTSTAKKMTGTLDHIVTKEELLEQLETSEKLLASVNQTWEQKMKQTEAIHKEREKALEKLGVIVEKNNMGIYAPKTVHLINLNEDPLMSECLMYQIKPGITRVGRLGSQVQADIRLSGSQILDEHCYFENVSSTDTNSHDKATHDDTEQSGDGLVASSSSRIVTIYPNKQAVTLVNGMRIFEPRRLHSGYRIIFGSGLHHLFRFNNPDEIKRERDYQQQQQQQQPEYKGHNNDGPQQHYHGEEATPLFITSSDVKSETTDSAMYMAGSPFSSSSATNNNFSSFHSSSHHRQQQQQQPPEIIDWSYAHNEALRHFGRQSNADLTKMTDEDLRQLSDGISKIRESRTRFRLSSDNNSLYSDSTNYSNLIPRTSISSVTSYSSSTQSFLSNRISNDGSYHQADFNVQHDKQTGRCSSLSNYTTVTQEEKEELIRTATEGMQRKLELQKQEYEEKIKLIESSNLKTSESDREKAILATKYALMKQQMERTMEEQKEVYESKIKRISAHLPPGTQLSTDNLLIGYNSKNAPEILQRWVVDKWRQLNYVKMAEECLVHAVLLKEANIMARELKKEVIYQFTVVHDDISAHPASFWEPTSSSSNTTSQQQQQQPSANGYYGESHLLKQQKPCLAVQVIDKLHCTTYIWSITKLRQRLNQMHNLYDYVEDNNKRLLTQQHFNREDPFHEIACPRYTLIGSARVPLQNLTLQLHADNYVDIYCRNTGKVMGQVRVIITPIARSISRKHAGNTIQQQQQQQQQRHEMLQQKQQDDVSSTTSSSLPNASTNKKVLLKRGLLKQRALSEKYLLHTGQQQVFEIHIQELKGINESDFTQVHVQYRLSSFGNIERFSFTDRIYQTDPVSGFGDGSTVEFGQCQTLSVHITSAMMDVILNQGLTVEVYGRMQEPYLYKLIEKSNVTATALNQNNPTGIQLGINLMTEKDVPHCYSDEPSQMKQQNCSVMCTEQPTTHVKDGYCNELENNKRFPFKRTFSTEQHTYNGILMRERHDILAWIQIKELNSKGEYSPVKVLHYESHALKNGRYVFCLRQGMQRRISLSLMHDSGNQLNWQGIEHLKVGNIRALDYANNNSKQQQMIDEAVIKEDTCAAEDLLPTFVNIHLLSKQNTAICKPNGITTLTVEGAWDSSLHDSLQLNRITPSGQAVCMSITWQIHHDTCVAPLSFNLDIMLQIEAREKTIVSSISSSSLFRQFLLAGSYSAVGSGIASTGAVVKIVDKSSSLFTLELKPRIAKHARDLWRLNSGKRYVRGEEFLGAWQPKGVSLITDYRLARQRMVLRESVAFFRQSLILWDHPQTRLIQQELEPLTSNDSKSHGGIEKSFKKPALATETLDSVPQKDSTKLLMKVLDLWKRKFGEQGEIVLSQNPPDTTVRKRSASVNSSISIQSEDFAMPKLIAQIRQVYPSDAVTKRGHLLHSENVDEHWIKNWFVLRRPYLLVYKDQTETEELSVLNLTQASVNYRPDMNRILQRKFTFEVYTANNAYIFQATTFDDMKDWLSKIDQFYSTDNLKEP